MSKMCPKFDRYENNTATITNPSLEFRRAVRLRFLCRNL